MIMMSLAYKENNFTNVDTSIKLICYPSIIAYSVVKGSLRSIETHICSNTEDPQT